MSEQSESASVSPAVIGWSIAAFVISIGQVFFKGGLSDGYLPLILAGFFTKCLAVVGGTICGTIFAMLGRAIGKAVDKPILIPVIAVGMGSMLGVRMIASFLF